MSKEDQRGGKLRVLRKNLHKKGLKRTGKKLQSKRSNKDYWKIHEHGPKKGSARNNILQYCEGKTSERNRRVRKIKEGK